MYLFYYYFITINNFTLINNEPKSANTEYNNINTLQINKNQLKFLVPA